MKQKNKVLLVGWDAADWDIALPLVEAGEMPGLEKIISTGVMGNLSTLEPPFSPMLWTSIATGKRPDKHGILGFVEPLPDGSGIRPVSSKSRKCKAIWNILMQYGLKSNVIGWWPSNPAEPIDGIMVSNLFHKTDAIENTWEMPPRSVHPEHLSDLMRHLRVHPMELSSQHIASFIPKLKEINQETDRRVATIGNLISEAASIQTTATWCLENSDWDFAGVYFDTIDHFCHGFINFHPPKPAWTKDRDFELYSEVVKSAYKMMDLMLQQLIKSAGTDTTVILVSDHGFKSGKNRIAGNPFEPAGPATQHREYGMFAMCGPGVKKDERIYGASLLDITPTILTILGLPVAKDMDGIPLVQAFVKKHRIDIVNSFESMDGNFGELPDIEEDNSAESAAAIKQLVELGYIEDPGGDEGESVGKTIDELQYNLARVLMGAGRLAEAKDVLEALLPKHMTEGRIVFRFIDCLKELNQVEEAMSALTQFRAETQKLIDATDYNSLLAEIKKQEKHLNHKHPLIKNFRKFKQYRLDIEHSIVIEAQILFANGQAKECVALLESGGKGLSQSIQAKMLYAKALTSLKKYKKALEIFNEILHHNTEFVPALLGKSKVLFTLKQWEESAEAALDAINLQYYNAVSHFYLGLALFKMEDYKRASLALETCLQMNPGIGKAKNTLIEIYSQDPADKDKLNRILSLNEQFVSSETNKIPELSDENKPILASRKVLKSKDLVYIVSGLPRSGTSLMMQMLEAGGLEVLTDKKRKPDSNNPKGYFELEEVKNSARNTNWLEDSSGKAVKVISDLLKYLPQNRKYKVIFMNRNIQEIVMSQQKFIGKENAAYPLILENRYKKHIVKMIQWFTKTHNMEVLHVNYAETINQPESTARKIKAFLGLNLNIEKMCSAVDNDLYRIKSIDN
jgi:predicted AlkP superfamily phosphohydrolase/phosphomutase